MSAFRVTIIGAESTGKTTLSRQLADALGGDWVCEFARPYLEVTDGNVTLASMDAIWHGQLALQHSAHTSSRPYVVCDTDLFATVGYWQLPHVTDVLGPCPDTLVRDALHDVADLYLVTQSNIPFEQDPLRYGGTIRESLDTYWTALCERFHLPYVVIASSEPDARLDEALTIIKERSTSCVVS